MTDAFGFGENASWDGWVRIVVLLHLMGQKPTSSLLSMPSSFSSLHARLFSSRLPSRTRTGDAMSPFSSDESAALCPFSAIGETDEEFRLRLPIGSYLVIDRRLFVARLDAGL